MLLVSDDGLVNKVCIKVLLLSVVLAQTKAAFLIVLECRQLQADAFVFFSGEDVA